MNLFSLRTAAIVLASSIIVCCAGAQFQSTNAHTGLYPRSIIHNGVSLHWKTKTDAAVRSTPALVGQKIIVGSSDGFLYCLHKDDGKILWRFDAGSPLSSSPVTRNGRVYVTSRANILFAVSISNGTVMWKKQLGKPMPYEWGFDYYIGSVAIDGNVLYAGSADGTLYALQLNDGTPVWTFSASSMIRSTPAVDQSHVYFGDCSGKVYALDKKRGTLKWRFATIGDTLHNEQFGFDRNAVISSPTLYKEKLFIGGRDGFLYALDIQTGRELWRYDYQVSWVISTAAVKDDILVTGTSDGRFVHALNVNNGTQLWRFTTNGPVWASPAISGNDMVVIPGNDGYVYCLALHTGIEQWRYKIGPQIFSSTLPVGNNLFFGSDDGCVYALQSSSVNRTSPQSVKRAVFWMKDPPIQSFRNGMDVYVRDYFIREGYEFYDETDVKDFLLARMKSDTASVLIFATNYFLPSITNDTLGSNLLHAYLQAGGRIVVMGLNPAAYELDSAKKKVIAINFEQAKRITRIPYRHKDLRTHGGFYSSFVTEEGTKRGLRSSFVGFSGIPVSDITTPLAIDENGRATAWVKTFSEKKHSGFIQLCLTPDRLNELPEIQQVAEYEMR